MAHEYLGVELLGEIDESGGGAGVKAVRAGHRGLDRLLEVGRSAAGRSGRGRAVQGRNDVARVRGGGEPRDQRVVVEEMGQPGEDVEVLVGLRRDAEDEPGPVSRMVPMPGDAGRHLEHGDGGAPDIPICLATTDKACS